MHTSYYALIVFLLVSCGTAVKEVPKKQKLFTTHELIAGANLLRAIADWPNETKDLQEKWKMTPKEAKKLNSPMHAIWGEEIEEFGASSLEDIKKDSVHCELKCHCTFYQMALEKFPELGARGIVISPQKADKKQILQCLGLQEVSPKLVKHLRDQMKLFEAEAAY